ncbi:MAG: LysR substrate-binding domain-containing protein, partial [Desulfuromonadales bacterium]|nr:LysR substrate-binding domain-containing protein [Desulfuromonadales bacterium]
GKDSDMIALKDLMEFRLFARRDGCSSKELLRSSLQAQSCDFDDFDGMVTSDDLRFTIQTVLDGNGAAFLSKSLISEHLASGDLTGLRVEGFEHQRGRSVVMLPQRREDALIKELLECLFAVVSPFWRPQALNSAS